MRARALQAFGLVAALLGVVALAGACKSKGNGVGTAPGNTSCPDMIVAGAPCTDLIMCGVCSGTCGCAVACGVDAGAGACPAVDASVDGDIDGETSGDADASVLPATVTEPAFFMFCPGGTGAVWECVQASDGGTFADAADAGESESDGDAASDADGEVGGDADATSETIDADADAGIDADTDAADAETDAIADTAPESATDADADGD